MDRARLMPATTRIAPSHSADQLAARTLPARPPLGEFQQSLGNQGLLRRLQAERGVSVGEDRSQLQIPPAHAISAPGDPCEQEADRVANQVMRGATAAVSSTSIPAMQRKCACGGSCAECAGQPWHLEQKSAGSGVPSLASSIPAVQQGLRSGGAPLDATTRAFMELNMGQDFSGVRLHTDERADESAASLRARAFTLGNHIAFRRGEYSPASSEGRSLLAHELVHVVQQGNPGVSASAQGQPPIAIRRTAAPSSVQRSPEKSSQASEDFKKSKEWRAYVQAVRDLKAADARLAEFKKGKEYAALQRVEKAEKELAVLLNEQAALKHQLAAAQVDATHKTELAAQATERARVARLKAEESRRIARRWTRIAGVVSGAFHSVEAAVACPLSETGIGAVGCIHAVTSLHADIKEVLSGENAPNTFQQAGSETAKAFGASPKVAGITGFVVDSLGGAASIHASVSTLDPIPASIEPPGRGGGEDIPPTSEPPGGGPSGEPPSDMRGDLTADRDVVVRGEDDVHNTHEGAGPAKVLPPATPETLPPTAQPSLPPKAIKHVFEGDYDGGYHSTARGPNPNVKVLKFRKTKPNATGVYKIKIEIQDARSGAIQQKDSTMFPDNWSETKILDETYAVMRANQRGPVDANGFSMIEGVSPSGVTIRIAYEHGVPQTFYPVLTGSK